ncbi:MAG: hypothetical protein P8P91_02375 [Pseudomonadales bacterium]|nr:hypothetical protein [Pseudomonadales bacterium]
MSEFEFVLILVSIVAGFAVSEILSGWGKLIRERAPISDTGLHLLASFWLLSMITRYVWVLWVFREIEWRFVDFILAFVPMLVLALAAYVTNPARVVNFNPTTHYLSQARPFCYLAAFFFVSWSLGSQRAFIPEGDIVAVPQIIGVTIAVVFMCLAHTKKQTLHGLGLGLLILVLMFMSSVAITNLGETPTNSG